MRRDCLKCRWCFERKRENKWFEGRTYWHDCFPRFERERERGEARERERLEQLKRQRITADLEVARQKQFQARVEAWHQDATNVDFSKRLIDSLARQQAVNVTCFA